MRIKSVVVVVRQTINADRRTLFTARAYLVKLSVKLHIVCVSRSPGTWKGNIK